jgi:alpha-tubulin suppressor-like RCC1 family protein
LDLVRPNVWLWAVLGACSGCVEYLQAFAPLDGGVQPTLNVTAVAASNVHSCAVWQGGLYCWGDNSYGQLGTGDLTSHPLPVPVGADSDWEQVQTGYESTCGLKRDGTVWCWGDDTDGQLGLGDVGPQTTPARVSLSFAANALALHFEHVCVLSPDGSLWCWGFNVEGQLGLNDNYPGQNQFSPVAVEAGTHWSSVDTGQGHTCGVQTDGSLWCWGRNTTGHLGLGASAPIQIRVPTHVGTDSNWTVARATQNSSCGLKTDDTLWCWGISYEAPISQQVIWYVPTPVDTGTDWVGVSIETFDICGLKREGTQWCWGRNDEGELGTGDTVSVYTPLEGAGTFEGGAVGRFHRCALDGLGGLYCTGANESGELGVGDTAQRDVLTPVQIR